MRSLLSLELEDCVTVAWVSKCVGPFFSKITLMITQDLKIHNLPRENEVREHIPVPYDNLFESILSFSQLFLV